MKVKKFIFKLIIYCLIIQLFGCYSPKYLTIDEIQNLDSNDRITLITKDNKEYILDNNNPGHDGYHDAAEWEIKNDTLFLITKQLVRNKDKPGQQELIKKSHVIKYEDIAAVSTTQEFNLGNTVLFSAGIIILVIIIGLLTMGPLEISLTEAW